MTSDKYNHSKSKPEENEEEEEDVGNVEELKAAGIIFSKAVASTLVSPSMPSLVWLSGLR